VNRVDGGKGAGIHDPASCLSPENLGSPPSAAVDFGGRGLVAAGGPLRLPPPPPSTASKVPSLPPPPPLPPPPLADVSFSKAVIAGVGDALRRSSGWHHKKPGRRSNVSFV
jgi:hypothetical protein